MQFSPGVLESFPGICVVEGDVRGVRISAGSSALDTCRQQITSELRSRYTLEQIRAEPVFRAYRDFFWSVGIDPTKTRPASEALVRRIVAGRPIPVINTAVDAYNLASASSGIPIAAFDRDRLEGELSLRFARTQERFSGIGMSEPVSLTPNQVVMTDARQIIAVYPYRDSEETKVTPVTRNIHIVTCGVPGIGPEKLFTAYRTCVRYLEEFSGGTGSEPRLYSER